jgi:TonB family protein
MGDLNLSQGSDPVSQPALPPRAPQRQPKPARVVRTSGPSAGGDAPDPDAPGTVVPTAMATAAEGASAAREVPPADARALPGPEFEGQVELNRPGQTSPDFVLLEFVRPIYPAGVPQVLRTRRIVVHVAMYVDLEGAVADAYVISSEGGALFDDAVLVAVRQWKYRPLQVAGEPQPFWDQVKVTFVGARPGTAPAVRVEGG